MDDKSIKLTLVVILLTLLQESVSWRTDRRPKIYGARLQLRSLTPRHLKVRKRLVQFHNFFRSRVHPPAANMLAMSWSREAAKAAQRWASECKLLVHDSPAGRTARGYGPCGQNIFVGTHQVPWYFAVKTWWLEKDNFTYGSSANSIWVVGHYTQMVWHSSHQLGCGLAYCKDAKPRPFYNYVCNYCPIGNFLESLGRPYEAGEPCSACLGHCRAKKFCTNACPFGDLWMNCKELARTFEKWLCNTKTKQGIERLKHCSATCRCKGKITYP